MGGYFPFGCETGVVSQSYSVDGRSDAAVRCQYCSNLLDSHRRNHGWRVGGDLTWSGCRSHSFPLSVPSPSPVIAPPMFSRSIPYFSFLRPLKFSKEVCGRTVSFPQCPAKNDSHAVVKKVGGTCQEGGSTVLTVRVRYIIKAPVVLMGLSN